MLTRNSADGEWQLCRMEIILHILKLEIQLCDFSKEVLMNPCVATSRMELIEARTTMNI
jgi:hypothetical protein